MRLRTTRTRMAGATRVGLAWAVLLAVTQAARAEDDPLERMRAMSASYAEMERSPTDVLPFCTDAAKKYEAFPTRKAEIVDLASAWCMRALRPNSWCSANQLLCGKDADRDATVLWLSTLSGFSKDDHKILEAGRAAAAERSWIRQLRHDVDAPNADVPCGTLGWYGQLLNKYATEVSEATSTGAPQTLRNEALKDLVTQSRLFRQKVYRSTVGIRDRHRENPSPEQLDELVKWFECLGDYQDAPQEAQKAKALAITQRTKQAAEARCAADPACRARKDAEEASRDAQDRADMICSLLAERKDAKNNIATEHRYARQTGVVSLSNLQDLKQTLRFLDEQIAERTAEYREATGKKFSPKVCQ